MEQPVTNYPLRVLLVEDEISLRDPLAKHLRREHRYEVDSAADLQEARSLLAQVERPYDVALIDDLLAPAPEEEPEYAGIALLREIKERWPETEVIIFTGWGMERALEALRAGAYRYLAKPLNLDELGMTIRMAAEQARLRRERDLLSATLEISKAMLSELDVEKTLEVIAEAVPKLAGAEACAVARVNPATGQVWYEPVVPLGDVTVRWRRHLRDVELTKRIIGTGEVFVLPDVDARIDEVDENLRQAGVKSFIAVPIPGEPQNLGVLYAYSTRQKTFGAHEQQVLQLLAGQAAIALENAQLYEETGRRAEEMRLLYDLSVVLNSSLDLEEVLDRIAKSASSLIQAETSTALIWDERRGCYIQRGVALTPERPVIVEEPRPDGFTTLVMTKNEPVIIPDVTRHKRAKAFLLEMGVRSMAGIPIQHSGKAIGVLFVHSTVPHRFGEHEVDLLSFLANQAALAIKNARLFEAESRRRREAETLRETALALTTTLDQQEIFERILSELQKVVPYDSASVQLLKDDRLEIIGGRGFPNLPDILGISFPIDGDNPNRVVMQRRAPFIVSDAPAEYEGFSQEPHIQADIHGWLGAPMLVGDRLIGMIALDKHQPGFYTEEHVRLAEAFAAQAAIAIENSRLFQAEREQREMAEALEEAAAIVSSTLDLDEVLDRILEQVERVVAGDAFNIMLIENSIARVVRWRGYEGLEQVAERTYPIAEVPGLLKMARTRETLIIPDTAIDPDWVVLEGREWIHSYVGAPINVRGQVVGFLNVNGTRPGQFAPADARRLEAFASHAATAIENARAFAFLQSLYEASSAIIAPQDPERVLHTIVEKACDVVNGWRTCATLVDENGTPTYLASVGFEPNLELATSIRPDGISVNVVGSGRPRFISDAIAERNEVHPKMIEQGVKAAACLPLGYGGKNIGVLWIHHTAPRLFSEAEKTALQIYANQAAVAYDKAQRIRKLEQMRKAAEAMAGALDLQQVLQQIVEGAKEVLQADSSAIWSYDNIRNQFIPEELVAYGIHRDELERFRKREPKKGGTADTVMDQGWIGVTDVSDPQYDFMGPLTLELLDSIGAKSFQGIALRIGDEKLGVLYVNYNRPRSFTDEGRRTLETFAYQATLALKKARLLEQVSKARDTARVVAEVSVLEDLRSTLNSIAGGTQDALDCDAVTLYTYDQIRDEFEFPPAMVGVRDTGEVLKFGLVVRESVIRRILALDGAYVAEDAPSDPVVSGAFVRREDVKSSVSIPLKVGDRKVGVIFVNYRSRHRFTGEELTNIELFAYQAAVAIRNAQLYEETIRRATALQILYEAGKAVTSTLAPDEILDRIVEQACRITGAHGKRARFSHLALVERNRLSFEAAYPPEHLSGLQRGVGDIDLKQDEHIGVTGWAVKTGQSQLVDDVTQYPDYIEYDSETRSELAVPIKLEEEMIGVINVEHSDANAFDESDRLCLESLAAQAAIAIKNARLYQAEQQRVKELEGLNSVSQSIRSLVSIHEVYQQVNESIAQLVGAQMCAILLYDKSEEALVCQLPMYGVPDEIGRRYCIPAGQGSPAGIVWETQDHLIINGVEQYPLVAELGLKELAEEAGLRDTLLVKLTAGNRNIGVIQASNRRDGRSFSEDDARLLHIFAGQAAVVIENAHLYEELKQMYEELKQTKGLVGASTALAWMGMASSAWRHAVEGRAITIRDEIGLLRSDLRRAKVSKNVHERLAKIERQAQKILARPITPPLSEEEGVESVSVNRLLRERISQLWENEPYKSGRHRFDFELDDAVTVKASPEWLRRVVDILVDNAVEAMVGTIDKQLIISTRLVNSGVEIVFTDTGKGIPDDVLPRLFKEQIKESKRLGMGLLMALTILQT